MATAKVNFQPPRGGHSIRKHRGAALRLLQAERTKDIFPTLLEEILALGYPCAAVLNVDFDSGDVRPAAAVNWPRTQLARLTTGLWVSEHPVTAMLGANRPAVLPRTSFSSRPVYLHPLLFSNRNPCWEADRARTGSCLAVQNFRRGARIRLEDQICSTCEMRGFAGVVAVGLRRHNNEASLDRLGDLIKLANACLSRLFKVEHYYNHMRDMEITIAQMSTVMQSMADPIILTDTQQRLVMLNKAAERFFKVPDEMTQGLVRAVELNNLMFSAALGSRLSLDHESHGDLTLVDTSEGDEMLFEAVSAPTYGPDEAQIGTVTVMRDVTQLRRADRELHANYEKLREVEETVRQDRDRLNLIIENVGDPIVVCDREGGLVLMDPLAQELFGAMDPLAHELFGNSDPALTRTQVRNNATFTSYIGSFIHAKTTRDAAPLWLYNPGHKQDIEYDARSGKIFDERGHLVYTVTVLRDLSALRRVEQLKIERRMLEIEKFAATGRLAATIAHEVNNPMEAIKNAIYLLAGEIPENALPVYNILKAETERVARVVRQMLGLYRSNEQVKPVNVNGIIEDTLALLHHELEKGKVEVLRDLGPLPDAIISPDQVRQVLSNLVINAKDAMPEGGTLTIRTRYIPSRGNLRAWVRLLVADTGVGIPPEMIRTVFEPFVTNKGEKGTGLGLWIVKGIIEHHTGKLRVRSKPGKGTVFCVDLPVAKP
ncbi:MAG TPA: ATP-binding protein [Terriglobales bacterium]